ncbi:MAG: ABC transporter permease [Acidobacteria bacterium]|nr:ABC transporter permease [Acidobacteriota bacterium]
MLLKNIVLRLRALFFRRRMDEALKDELEFHIEMQARKNERYSADPEDAKRQARLQFGSVVTATEECREERGISTIEILAKDVRFGLRMLRKSPSFTAVAVVTLALAIGANAVAFGALNALILRPLNVPQAESLYALERGSNLYNLSMTMSYPNYLDLRDRNQSFDGLAAFNVVQAGLDTGANPSSVWVVEASGNYFDVLRLQPHLGRFFHGSDENGPNTAPYIVLSYAYWHSRFQDDPGVIGRTVLLNKHPFTIIGVAPRGFYGPTLVLSPDLFVPIVNQELMEGRNLLNRRGFRWIFMTLGHLKDGVTPAQAIADLNSIGSYLEKTYPVEVGPMNFQLARPNLFGNLFGRPIRAFLAGVMLLAGFILLAACANLGSLFAARASDRSRELALRLALGASRTRILQQLFTEAVLISLIGGAAGLAGSVVLLRSLSAWNPAPSFPIILSLDPDATVLGVALLLTVASGFLFGAVPVRQALRTDPYEIVKSGSIVKIGRRINIRDVLLVVQIAICAVLVTSSLVAVRGMVRTLQGDFGIEPRNAILIGTVLEMAGYRGDAVPAMQKRMVEEMAAIPGVASVGVIDRAPLTSGWATTPVFTDDATDLNPANSVADALMYSASPGYFQAAGTVLVSGRDFSWHDDKASPVVAVVNREFARRIFGSPANVVGRHFKRGNGTRLEVVGIVEDGKYAGLTEDPKPALFLSILQSSSSMTSLVVRPSGDLHQISPALRRTMRELDPGLPFSLDTWYQKMDMVLFPSRVATVSLGVLGLMGAMLSMTGIFGMAAYSVSKRKRELGIRMALGAERKEVIQAAVGRAFKLLAFGSASGLFLGILASRVLAVIVYEATPRDPVVLAGVVLAMLSLGLLATWIPARRALSIDPQILLREE